jgi:glucose-1-phosphatase
MSMPSQRREFPLRAVIFDMGGVLVRTYDNQPQKQLAARFGLTQRELVELIYASKTAMDAMAGQIPEEEHRRTICDQLHFPESEIGSFFDTFWKGDDENQDLIGFVRRLRSKYKTAILSNAWSGARKELESRYHFLDAFDEQIFSADVRMAKPEPGIYHLVLNRLGILPPDVVFIDDFIENVEGAKRVGMQAIHFRDTDQIINALKSLGVTE